jgi:hypothetical protein
MRLEGAVFDPNTGNVWVVAEHSERSHGTVVSTNLWVQLVGENVVGVPNVNPSVIYNFSLSPAFPNPFNLTTTINFSIPRASDVSMGIFDISGRLSDNLVSGKITAGNHAIVWDASAYPTGIYFCRMQAASFVETRKLVLMK